MCLTLIGVVPEAHQAASFNATKTGRLVLTLPATGQSLLLALRQVSQQLRCPMGADVVIGTDESRDVIALGEIGLDLSSLSLDDAMNRLVSVRISGQVQNCEWSRDNGIVHVRPKDFRNARAVMTNRVVERFDFDGGVQDAALAILRIFDSTYPSRSTAQKKPIPERVKPFLQLPMSVHEVQASVRSLLDAFVLRQRSMSWFVEYRSSTGTYPNVRVGFMGFDGWDVRANSKPAKVGSP
jgi:hypothetical protein